MLEDETLFDAFWESSSLDKFNVQQFAQQLNAYDSDNKELHLEYPTASYPLPKSRSQINNIAKKRKSNRTFSGQQLSIKELGRLLSSFYAWNGLEHRGYPSAGATYVTEIFVVCFNVEQFSGKILYYDAEEHGAVVLSDNAPPWDKASETLNVEITGTPSLLLLFTILPERATAKYGDRGGRFALLEAGAAMQQLVLQVAESSRLKGVAVGGILDETWRTILKLEQTNARVALGYLIGR